MDALSLWRRRKELECVVPALGLHLDISRMNFQADFWATMEPAMASAYEAMADLEAGEIANPDEGRQVGHYWLRLPHLAPTEAVTAQIDDVLRRIREFAAAVHSRQIAPPVPEPGAPAPQRFTDLLVIGIGGSALGPQLVADALASRRDRLNVHFMDNTDPDGFDRVLAGLGGRLKSTLVLVVSKSGSTPETRNGMVEAKAAYEAAGLTFHKYAVAITGEGSRLDQLAADEQWLARFPMWDWVGGRTSVLSAVGLLPAALQGIDIDALLQGAAEMDKATRSRNTRNNPAALLALMWHHATGGRGLKDMVILPYKDRLLLLSRYLQQLVMESLGKSHDLAGNPVHQGIAVYGNKGSTDQHAYVQQLRDGLDNFFVTFIVVLQDRQYSAAKKAPEVEPGVTSGDYLSGFWQGTRQALAESGRESLTITVQQLDPQTLGGLIALFERAVGFYATLINVNAYHQPGVEAGKKAAAAVLEVQHAVTDYLGQNPEPQTPEQIADRMGRPHDVETIYHVLEHLAANKRHVAKVRGKYRGRA